MDLCHDCNLLWRHGCRPHLHHHDCHSHTDHLVQRSHSHIKRTQSGEELTIYENFELVLFGDDDVFPLWGERGILLQTHYSG